jgi:hypothetical protein
VIKLKRREILSNSVNKKVRLNAIYSGAHFLKGNAVGKAILLKDVRLSDGELVDDHLWAGIQDYLYYQQFKKGDRLDIVGKVRKYKKVMAMKVITDFSIDIIDMKKVIE